MAEFLSICLNPTIQRTVSLPDIHLGTVNRAKSVRVDASGKGVNVTRVLSQLGGDVRHITHVGPQGEDFLKRCADDGLDVAWVPAEVPVRTCTTLLDLSTSDATEIVEESLEVGEKTVQALKDLFLENLPGTKWVVLSGSKAAGYPDTLFAEFCAEATRAGVKVLADYRGADLSASLPYKPDVIKINMAEFVSTFFPGLAVREGQEDAVVAPALKRAEELSKEGIRVVMTRGSQAIHFAENGKMNSLEPQVVVPVNPIGSGDSFAAGLAYGLSQGADLNEAVILGADCGSKNAALLKPGVIR